MPVATDHNDDGERTGAGTLYDFILEFGKTVSEKDSFLNPSGVGSLIRMWDIGLGSEFRSKMGSSPGQGRFPSCMQEEIE